MTSLLQGDSNRPRRRVFVVDDDLSYGELTRRRLERLGFEARFHAGSRGAVSELLSGRFDAVLLDINMPGFSGPDVIKMIRTSTVSIKVMFFSSMDIAELRQLAAAHGADGYVSKGASSKELEVRLHDMLGLSGMPSSAV